MKLKGSKILGVLLIVGLLLALLVSSVAAAYAPKVEAPVAKSGVEVLAVKAEATETGEDPFAKLPETVAASASIVLVINGLVAFLKKLGVKDIQLTVSAFALGLIIGVAYRYALTPLTSFSGWLFAVLYGSLLGLVATGVYDAFHGTVASSGSGG